MARLRRIEYGVPSGNDALTVRFGIERGLFEAEGLDLSTRIVFGGPDLAAAFGSGALPVGSLGSPSGIPGMAAGQRFRIVASGCRQRAHMYLGVAKGIDSYDALRGKRLGILSIGSCPTWIARRILRRNGLDPDRDVEMVPLHDEYPRIVDILAEGRIDAMLATEPNLSIGAARGLLDIWAAGYDAPYLPRFQWIVRVANTDFIEREPETLAAVLRGCRRSAHCAADHFDDFVRFVARQYDTDETTARHAMQLEMPHYELDCRLDLDGLQAAVDLLHEQGGLDRPMQATDFTDLRFQDDPATAAN